MFVALGSQTRSSWRHGPPDPDRFLEVCPVNLGTVGKTVRVRNNKLSVWQASSLQRSDPRVHY